MSQSVMSLVVLGATGSIGRSTLDVVKRNADRFSVFALTAHSDVDTLFQQIQEFSPQYAALADIKAAEQLRQRVGASAFTTEILSGPESLVQLAEHEDVDAVMAAIVGAAGLPSALAAAEAGKRLLLANKESLVVAGQLLMDAVNTSGAELLPIDSEHNAVFQCWPKQAWPNTSDAQKEIRRVVLTASGGPFREWTAGQMQAATPEQAVAHPNWSMGAKISVDSATMMNKGLEVIEACWLFQQPDSLVDVVVHPQSIVHSMVEYVDGSVLAELGHPDMRTPIAQALAWPERVESGVGLFDIAKAGALTFETPDLERFPCLSLARQAIRETGAAPAALNAANEVAVELFLKEQVGFTDIARVIESVLSARAWGGQKPNSVDELLSVDNEARSLAYDVAHAIRH